MTFSQNDLRSCCPKGQALIFPKARTSPLNMVPQEQWPQQLAPWKLPKSRSLNVSSWQRRYALLWALIGLNLSYQKTTPKYDLQGCHIKSRFINESLQNMAKVSLTDFGFTYGERLLSLQYKKISMPAVRYNFYKRFWLSSAGVNKLVVSTQEPLVEHLFTGGFLKKTLVEIVHFLQAGFLIKPPVEIIFVLTVP